MHAKVQKIFNIYKFLEENYANFTNFDIGMLYYEEKLEYSEESTDLGNNMRKIALFCPKSNFFLAYLGNYM